MEAQEVNCQQPSLWPLALPTSIAPAAPSFVLGMHDADSFIRSFTAAYAEITHWKKNQFTVPLGNPRKMFVGELSHLFRTFANQSALESVALLATTVMPTSKASIQLQTQRQCLLSGAPPEIVAAGRHQCPSTGREVPPKIPPEVCSVSTEERQSTP